MNSTLSPSPNSPLADRARPLTFDDIAGQEHLFGREKGILRKMAERGVIPSMVFFGPPGCGKTTAASIIASSCGKPLYKLNATTASLSDIRDVAKDSDSMLGANGVLLYLDEIQYFNKKQQQSLLEYLEDGRITLIASTTENPYYYIYDALLSRCSVFEFRHVSAASIEKRVADVAAKYYPSLTVEPEALKLIADGAGGDVRRALTTLEVAANSADEKDGHYTVDAELIRSLTPSVAQSNFDRDGDVHYDLLSCLQKSIRGSDPDAAVFYLARLLAGGDLISPCRRLMVIASEDIGEAYPMAAVIVRACVESAKELGLPEARIPLANAAVMLATAPKSNSAYKALDAAMEDINAGKGSEIPRHLRSPKFDGYVYPHDFENHWTNQQYLPDDLNGKHYYEYGDNKTEQAAKAYWEKIKKKL